MSGERLLTVKEYAEMFRCSVAGVRLAIRERRLPYPTERPLGGTRSTIYIRVPAELVAKLRAA